MPFRLDHVVDSCERFGVAIRRLGGRSPPLEVGPRATEAEVADVEARLGRRIPSVLRGVLIEQARSFSFAWERDHFELLPHPWKHASEGRCLWSLDLLLALNADLEGWREAVYSDPTDEYARHWHGAFAVCATGLSDGTSFSTDFSGAHLSCPQTTNSARPGSRLTTMPASRSKTAAATWASPFRTRTGRGAAHTSVVSIAVRVSVSSPVAGMAQNRGEASVSQTN